MLEITIPKCEFFDEEKEEFIYVKETTIKLEHSLVSLSKWESKWHKPYLVDTQKTTEELIDYIRCMTITQNVDDNAYFALTEQNINEIGVYINNPMTATIIRDVSNSTSNKSFITSELIYYFMFSYNIPIECQKWHLNRLLTLIQVFNVKNSPPKKMSQEEIFARNRELNAKRKQMLNTKG